MNKFDGVSELIGDEGGIWSVQTQGSAHIFDLDAMTVTRERVPWPRTKHQ